MYITAFTAPRESFAVEFVVMKHFGWESSNVQPSCCLDVVVYMLNCVFWRHIPLEIEFKVVAQTMHSGVTHERCADFRHGKKRKKQKRGEFITPPRPTGRRSNKTIYLSNESKIPWQILSACHYNFVIFVLEAKRTLKARLQSNVRSFV